MISLAAIPTDRPSICLRLRVLRCWARGLAATALMPACRISAALPPSSPLIYGCLSPVTTPTTTTPPTDGLELFTQGEKDPKPNKYNKQKVIMGKVVVITIYWSPKKMEIDLSLLIIRCDLIMCPRLFWLFSLLS